MVASGEENENSRVRVPLMPMDPHPDAPPYYMKPSNANEGTDDDKNNTQPPVMFMEK
jgi:hypothetical protein